MSGTPSRNSTNLAGGEKRRSSSGQGGLLHRMFGSSNGKDGSNSPHPANLDGTALSRTDSNISTAPSQHDGTADPDSYGELKSPTRKPSDTPSTSGEKKRRSSGVGRARDLFSSAKQSLANLGSPDGRSSDRSPQTPMQKLGKTDPALSVPQGSLNNSAGESAPGPRSTFRVGVTEDKNKKCRRTMEDTHAYLYNFMSTPAPALTAGTISPYASRDSAVSQASSGPDMIETDNGYFAIFDGHAGTFAADWCGKKVHLLLEDIIRKNPNTPIPELLDMTFTNVDQQLEKLPLKNSGCTAVCAVLRWEDRIPNSQSATGSSAIAPATAAAAAAGAGEHNEESQSTTEAKLKESASRQRVLYTANVGDARIVLCRNGKALRLSYDHKGSDENEGKRVAGAGGLILNNRVNGVLAVTRALGDAYMKDLVTGHPYTTETVIQPDIDEFLILACDGLWDVCTDQEAVDLVRNVHDPQAASKALVDHALARFSTDNLSCMIVRFDVKAVQETVEHKVEPIGVEGDAASQGIVTESQAIVANSKKTLEEGGGDHLDRIPSDLVEEPEPPEPGVELNPAAVEAARKDRSSEGRGSRKGTHDRSSAEGNFHEAQMTPLAHPAQAQPDDSTSSLTTANSSPSAPATAASHGIPSSSSSGSKAVNAHSDLAVSPHSQPLSLSLSQSATSTTSATTPAGNAPNFVAPSSYLRAINPPRPSYSRSATSNMQRQRDIQTELDQVEGLKAIRAFLKVRTTYDVLPLSYRLIVLDTSLLVKKSLNILIQCGIVSAPLWDSKTSTFAGLLTTSDYLNVVQYYWQNPNALNQIDQFRLNSLRDIERALGVSPLETVSIHPLKTLYEACRKMLESRARRIPLVDVDDETQREMVVSVLTQYRILKFITVNVTHTQMLRKPLRDLKIGSYNNLATATMETPVIEVIQQLVTRSISSVPILDKDGTVMNLFEAVDVIALIKGGDYDNLREHVGKALERRSEDFPGIYTCTLNDRLDTIFETIRKSRVHRLVIINESRRLVGLLSLSDILDYALNSPLPEIDTN